MIIVLGMAGAGKSTQCQRLADSGQYQWLSVGKLLRSIDIGDKKTEMLQGMVLDDSFVQPIVQAEIDRLGDMPELLLDGCPRTVEQAKWLASASSTPNVRMVLHLTVDDERALGRLLSRSREDDSEDAIRARFAGYHRDIHPVLNEFISQSIPVFTVDANASADEVFKEIIEKVQL